MIEVRLRSSRVEARAEKEGKPRGSLTDGA
jgi:hypothetical protein